MWNMLLENGGKLILIYHKVIWEPKDYRLKPFCKVVDTIKLEEYKNIKIGRIMIKIEIFKHALDRKLCLLLKSGLCDYYVILEPTHPN